jgi:hypothetical protein
MYYGNQALCSVSVVSSVDLTEHIVFLLIVYHVETEDCITPNNSLMLSPTYTVVACNNPDCAMANKQALATGRCAKLDMLDIMHMEATGCSISQTSVLYEANVSVLYSPSSCSYDLLDFGSLSSKGDNCSLIHPSKGRVPLSKVTREYSLRISGRSLMRCTSQAQAAGRGSAGKRASRKWIDQSVCTTAILTTVIPVRD